MRLGVVAGTVLLALAACANPAPVRSSSVTATGTVTATPQPSASYAERSAPEDCPTSEPSPVGFFSDPLQATGPGSDGWTRGSLVFNVSGMVFAHGTYVVSGSRHGGVYSGEGHLEVSTDAAHWHEMLTHQGPANTLAGIDGVVATPTGFAAWGYLSTGDAQTQTVWTADPTARTWTVVASGADVVAPDTEAVADGRGGWMALGDQASWRSSDAVHWTRTPLPDGADGRPGRILPTGDGWLAFLDRSSGFDDDQQWLTSTDGTTWTLHTDSHTDPVFPIRFGSITGVTSDAAGLVALSDAEPTSPHRCYTPTLWRSADQGRTWTRQPPLTGLDHAQLTDVATLPDGGLVATGIRDRRRLDAHLGLWTSRDGGTSWSSILPDSSFLEWGDNPSTSGLTIRVLEGRVIATVEYVGDKALEDTLEKPLADLGP